MHDQKPMDNFAECLKISFSFIVIEMHTAVAIQIATSIDRSAAQAHAP
jgi:hypothetical protein